jgi:hypothetical protein
MTMDQKIKAQADAALAKWGPLSVNEEEAHINAPVHVVLGEAVDVAAMIAHYWDPRTDSRGARTPGFAGVKGGPQVTLETANEIRELQLAITSAHSEYLVLVQAAADTPLDRADFVLSEIRSALQFLFDDGKHDDSDEQLARLEVAFADSSSQDAMALALEGYAELARLNESGLTAITGFDVALIEEARTVAAALREQSASALTRTNPDAQRRVLGLRNRLLTMLIDRVRRARRTAQYVFRDHPEVIRKFSSAYERRQRATRRRNAKEAEEATEVEGPKTNGDTRVASV